MEKISPALQERIKRTKKGSLVEIVISTKPNGKVIAGNRVKMVKDYLREHGASDIYGLSSCNLVSAKLPRYLVRPLAEQLYVSMVYFAEERIDVLKD